MNGKNNFEYGISTYDLKTD